MRPKLGEQRIDKPGLVRYTRLVFNRLLKIDWKTYPRLKIGMIKNRLAFRLTPDQEKAVEMLASGCTIKYTALVLGLKSSTVSGWVKQDKHFKAKIASRRQESAVPVIDEQAS